MHVKKHRDYLERRKLEIVGGKMVIESEAEPSAHSAKMLNFEKYKAYLNNKNETNCRLAGFYGNPKFHKMGIERYMGRQKTQARMLNEFSEKYGPLETTFIAIGNYTQLHHRKFNEPVKGK
jgi:ribosomal protein S4